MSEYKIEKNIPMTKGLVHKEIYPFSEMEVGDSFAINCKTEKDVSNQRLKVLNQARKFINSTNSKMKFGTRLQPNNIIRVWRTF
jgi:hypothetical protein